MSSTFWEILLILFLIGLNGMLAMSEIALVSVRKVRLEQRLEDGDRRAKVALDLAENQGQLLSTVQVGITVIGVFSGALGGATLAEKLAVVLQEVPLLASYSEEISLVLVVVPITYLSLVIGELIPKRLALANPEQFALRIAYPMLFLSKIVRPVAGLLSASTNLGMRLFGGATTPEPAVTEEEIRVMLDQGTQLGVLNSVEQDIVESVFRLADRTADAIMTSRLEITWLDCEEPFEDILKEVIETRHSYFPVGEGSLDNIQGILSAKDLLAAVHHHEKVDLRGLLTPPFFAPESMPALKVLEEMKTSGVPVAIVLDEFGGVLGMITPLDILRSIVGEISEEGEAMERQAVQRDDGSWLLDGLLRIDEMKELLDLDDLPEEDRVGYQTVGGMMMSALGTIPEPGQHFEWEGFRFEVMDMDNRRVDKVLVTPLQPPEEVIV